MLTLPEISERPEQPYAYMNFTVRMDQMQMPAEEGFPALFAFLAEQGLTQTGPAFYNYRRIDMANTLDVEAGVPVQRAGEGTKNIHFGTLPAGRFAGLTWVGHPDQLEPATAVLIGWVRFMQHDFDMEEGPDGDHFACRMEIYETDPDEEPDMDNWVIHLAFKLRE